MTWQGETKLSVRGLPIVMPEQLVAHHCPVQLEWPKDADTADPLIPLSQPSCPRVRAAPDRQRRCVYMLQLRVLSLREHAGIFGFGDHLEQSADFDDMVVCGRRTHNG